MTTVLHLRILTLFYFVWLCLLFAKFFGPFQLFPFPLFSFFWLNRRPFQSPTLVSQPRVRSTIAPTAVQHPTDGGCGCVRACVRVNANVCVYAMRRWGDVAPLRWRRKFHSTTIARLTRRGFECNLDTEHTSTPTDAPLSILSPSIRSPLSNVRPTRFCSVRRLCTVRH